MNHPHLAAFTACVLLAAWASAGPVRGEAEAGTESPVRELASGVDLVPGQFGPGGQPDGNSVVFHGRDGLVIVDTGRHPAHTQQLVDLAARAKATPKVIVNTHWHLDHTGGNLLLRERFPGIRVYASDAIVAARKGFLAHYREQLANAIARGGDAPEAAGYRAEMGLIDAADRLAPDVVLTKTAERTLAGRKLVLGLERHAVTAGDVWVLDPESGVLAAGDLVTLPVPLLDTACPRGWKEALDDLAKQRFRILVPGHGEPTTPVGLDTYRAAFAGLLGCTASKRSDAECAEEWFRTLGELAGATDPTFARTSMMYYIGKVLRGDPHKLAAACRG
jgi:glyoxylase-like metal-dependent hydrolase (beta-lactamase superfamily II)